MKCVCRLQYRGTKPWSTCECLNSGEGQVASPHKAGGICTWPAMHLALRLYLPSTDKVFAMIPLRIRAAVFVTTATVER